MAYTTITDPSAYFHTQLYTGNATDGVNITNDANAGDFKPDWIWIKNRTGSADWHDLTDSTRGVTKSLFSNTNSAESTQTGAVQAFLTDGFTIGNNPQVNRNANNYAAWQWKANGGTTASNSSGNITSTVQANTTAGFSIVKYTGNGASNQTVGHGLGATPDCLIWKNYDQARSGWNWKVWHKGLSGTNYLILNNTDAQASSNGDIDALPTSTLFTVGTNGSTNDNGYDIVCYAFTSIKGYSKFGSYSGNQSTDGPFLYFGFKPAFLIVKKTSSAENWFLIDSKRYPLNTGNIPRLNPNNTDAESTDSSIAGDFLSNGFKIRATQNMINESGTYIYMAFAENPFVAPNGVPTTAR